MKTPNDLFHLQVLIGQRIDNLALSPDSKPHYTEGEFLNVLWNWLNEIIGEEE